MEYALVVLSAGTAGYVLGWGHSYWAMASAAVPLAAADLPGRIGRGLHRIIGTLAGLIVTAAVLVGTPPPGFLAIVVIVLIIPTEALMSRHYAAALVFFTPMILIMTQLAAPVPRSQLIVDRAAETALGAVIGMLVVCAISGTEALLRRATARTRE
ncbi:FUSC family protein [Microbacterium nymphoidis]|nr:FUSC family protein [Microbacterium nymphoidis]MCD2497391.1 FUSC family protein [Microbacterium nymphoidis]